MTFQAPAFLIALALVPLAAVAGAVAVWLIVLTRMLYQHMLSVPRP